MSINNKYQPLYVASDSTITSVENASSNLQFCEVNNSINTISIPTLINQNTNEDLNLSSYNGTNINPIIQINNTYQHVNITSNLNVASNLNVYGNFNVADIMSIKTLVNKDTSKDLNLSAYNGTNINPIIQINNTYQHVNITSNLNVASNLNITNSLKITESYRNIDHDINDDLNNTRKTFLVLGNYRDLLSPDEKKYPVIRIQPPFHSGGPWFFIVQDYTTFAYLKIMYGSNAEICSFRSDGTFYANILSKASGSFKIDHPLDEKNKKLIHSFVEAPRCDNIYSGKVKLINGKAYVNLDNNDYYKMMEGTFLALNKDFRIYINNNDFDNWDLVKGKIEGNILKIISNNNNSNVTVDWMVIGTRKDTHILNCNLTDNNGDLITEI